MPVCGTCGREMPLLVEASKFAIVVHFYRCEPCGDVWVYQLLDPDRPPRLVTNRAARANRATAPPLSAPPAPRASVFDVGPGVDTAAASEDRERVPTRQAGQTVPTGIPSPALSLSLPHEAGSSPKATRWREEVIMADPPSRNVRVAPPCPACGQPTPQHLDESSEGTFVDYYRCAGCNHIWAVDKRDASKVTHVTPFLRPKKDRRTGT